MESGHRTNGLLAPEMSTCVCGARREPSMTWCTRCQQPFPVDEQPIRPNWQNPQSAVPIAAVPQSRATPFTRTFQFRVLLVVIALLPVIIMVLTGSTGLMGTYLLALGVCRVLWYSLVGAGLVRSTRI